MTASATPRPAPALSWHACDDGFECATARVPLDHRHPHGAMIDIAVIRHPATDAAHRIGSLFVNGGGPSEQIDPVRAVYAQLPAAWRARFDIVAFDPRGFGHSTAVRCFPTMDAERDFLAGLPVVPVTPRQIATWDRTWARFDARCARRNGALLRHDSTADVARDMDLLRQAVGDPMLNYVATSYGTGLGAVYANLFPGRVGRMILDGNLDPVSWTHGDGRLPAFLRMGADRASAATLKAFLDLCGKSSTCAFSAGSPAATHAKFEQLLSRLRDHPVPVGTPPDVVSCDDVCAVLSLPLSQVSAWKDAADQLQQLWTAPAKSRPVRAPAERAQSPATYAGQEHAVRCSDGANPHYPRTYTADAKLAVARSALISPSGAWADEPCANRLTAQAAYAGQEQSYAVRCSDGANPRDPHAYAADAKLAVARSGPIGPSGAWADEPCANRLTAQAAYAGQKHALRCSDSANPRDPRAYTADAKLAVARSGPIGPSRAWADEPCANRLTAQAVYAGQEQSYAVRCSDGANPRDPRAYAAGAKLAVARSGLIGLSWVWADEPCANWPTGQDAYTGPWNRRTANPILLLGNTGDPATSYANSLAMSRSLSRARLLTVDGYGHTEFGNPSTCAREYEDRYLLTGALPASGTVCEQDAAPFT